MPNRDAATMTGTGDVPRPPRPRATSLHDGTLVARRYRLVAKLGTGAMGEVWLARHEELHTDVAVKFALAEEDDDHAIDRFRFEAQVSAQLGQKTPHIVAVHDAGRHAGVPYLAMEYVPGRSVEDILRAEGTLDEQRVAAILDDIAAALEVAHAQGIWHRDIKPANIMVIEGEAIPRAKLTDFGVSKDVARKLQVESPGTTVEGNLVGTPSYMSPEQIEGGRTDGGAPSDLWSLAVVAYECLTGKMAFRAETVSQLLVTICSRPHLPPGLEAAHLAKYDAFFSRALAKDPASRFGSATELAAAFRTAMASPRRRLVVTRRAVAVALGVVAALTAASLMLTRAGPEVAAEEATPESVVSPDPPSDTSSPSPAPPKPMTTSVESQPAVPSSVTEPPSPTSPAPAPSPPLSATPPTSAPPPTPEPKPQPRAFDPSEVL